MTKKKNEIADTIKAGSRVSVVSGVWAAGIWKNFPIHYIEKHLGLGSGIMTDDVIAGVYTLIVLQSARMLIEMLAA